MDTNKLYSRSSHVTCSNHLEYQQTHQPLSSIQYKYCNGSIIWSVCLVWHQVRKEVDLVPGPDQLPEFGGLPNLTFISTIAKEVLRFVHSYL